VTIVASLAVLFGSHHVSASCSALGYDLSALGNSVIKGTDPQKTYNYLFTPCGVSADTECAGFKGSLCQYLGANFEHVIGSWLGSPTGGNGNGPIPAAVWAPLPASLNLDGVQVTLNGEWSGGCTPAAFRVAVVYFICAKDGPLVPAAPFSMTNTGCNYQMIIPTSAACKSSSSSKKLSGGTVFLIILIVVIPVYVAVGCVYKRKRQGQTGMEACPNVEFWRDLPVLIKDGFSFTYRKLRGLCGGSGESYETVK